MHVKECEMNCSLVKPVKSSVALHHLETEHKIRFEDSQVLWKTSHYYKKIHRETLDIFKHQNYSNHKEKSLKVNKLWLAAVKNTTFSHKKGTIAD